MTPDRSRPTRGTPRRPRTLRNVMIVLVMAVAGAGTGLAVADADGKLPGATWLTAPASQAVPAVLAPVPATASAPAPAAATLARLNPAPAVAPVTAPVIVPTPAAEPAPAVSVAPGLNLAKHSLDDPASPWVVVNKQRPLDPEQYVPDELSSAGGVELVPEASQALVEMRAAAADADTPLSVGTGYRGYDYQQTLFSDYVAKWGVERADRFSARPGHSEHQAGWAVDVYGSTECRLKECFAEEPAGQWITAHGHEYGFIVRYPPGAEDVTGYKHEPWHLRYVGVELATAMHEDGIATMEEFFSLPAAPDYD